MSTTPQKPRPTGAAEQATVALGLAMRGEERPRLIRLANEAFDARTEVPALRLVTTNTALRALVLADALDSADELLKVELDDEQEPVTFGDYYLTYLRADICARRGQLGRAREEAAIVWNEARRREWPLLRSWAAGLLMALAAMVDDVGAGYDVLVSNSTAGGPRGDTSEAARLMVLAGRGQLHLRAGRVRDGVSDLRACGERLTAARSGNPSAFAWRIPLALAVEGAEGRALVTDELVRARRFGAARPIARALRAQALLEPALADRERGLQRALATATRSPGLHERALITADLAMVAHHRGAPLQAEERWGAAAELAQRCGDHGLARDVWRRSGRRARCAAG